MWVVSSGRGRVNRTFPTVSRDANRKESLAIQPPGYISSPPPGHESLGKKLFWTISKKIFSFSGTETEWKWGPSIGSEFSLSKTNAMRKPMLFLWRNRRSSTWTVPGGLPDAVFEAFQTNRRYRRQHFSSMKRPIAPTCACIRRVYGFTSRNFNWAKLSSELATSADASRWSI